MHKILQKFTKMRKTVQILIIKKQILVFIRVHSWFLLKKQSQFSLYCVLRDAYGENEFAKQSQFPNTGLSFRTHSTLLRAGFDAESIIIQKTWIPAFAGMTDSKGYLPEYDFAKQSQFCVHNRPDHPHPPKADEAATHRNDINIFVTSCLCG